MKYWMIEFDLKKSHREIRYEEYDRAVSHFLHLSSIDEVVNARLYEIKQVSTTTKNLLMAQEVD